MSANGDKQPARDQSPPPGAGAAPSGPPPSTSLTPLDLTTPGPGYPDVAELLSLDLTTGGYPDMSDPAWAKANLAHLAATVRMEDESTAAAAADDDLPLSAESGVGFGPDGRISEGGTSDATVAALCSMATGMAEGGSVDDDDDDADRAPVRGKSSFLNVTLADVVNMEARDAEALEEEGDPTDRLDDGEEDGDDEDDDDAEQFQAETAPLLRLNSLSSPTPDVLSNARLAAVSSSMALQPDFKYQEVRKLEQASLKTIALSSTRRKKLLQQQKLKLHRREQEQLKQQHRQEVEQLLLQHQQELMQGELRGYQEQLKQLKQQQERELQELQQQQQQQQDAAQADDPARGSSVEPASSPAAGASSPVLSSDVPVSSPDNGPLAASPVLASSAARPPPPTVCPTAAATAYASAAASGLVVDLDRQQAPAHMFGRSDSEQPALFQRAAFKLGLINHHGQPTFDQIRIDPVKNSISADDLPRIREKLGRLNRLRKKYQTMSFQYFPSQNPMNRRPAPVNNGQTPPYDPFNEPLLPSAADQYHYTYTDGIFRVMRTETGEPLIPDLPDAQRFYSDLDVVLKVASDGPVKSFCFRRLAILEASFNLHTLLNDAKEKASCKLVPHRDFYNVRKVDTHVHLTSGMNQKHLLRFIRNKLRYHKDEVVLFRDGRHYTLAEVFQSLGVSAYDLSIDTLDMHVQSEAFHRFDRFNAKYNPVGESRLREIFMKTDNYMKGRYFAELTKQLINDLEDSKYQFAEYRVSIYGRSIHEWDNLAAWVIDNRIFSPNVRWLIQTPRLYELYRKGNSIESFDDIVRNIFQPLFEVTMDPSSHPKLFLFLQQVVGFDSVDDESKLSRAHMIDVRNITPAMWNEPIDPPYSYYLYYTWVNMTSLNALRAERDMNTFVLRPHCGEAGMEAHSNLAVSFLLSQSIAHGILLRKVPTLQYLYYLNQIGIHLSPLSNNSLFLSYDRNPIMPFFRRGLNISLSTDDPLQFHFTREPLIEEYAVAAQILRLSTADLCELARNSVLQSGFERCLKMHWIGREYWLPDHRGNDMACTNVPQIRVVYRAQTLQSERAFAGMEPFDETEAGRAWDAAPRNFNKRSLEEATDSATGVGAAAAAGAPSATPAAETPAAGATAPAVTPPPKPSASGDSATSSAEPAPAASGSPGSEGVPVAGVATGAASAGEVAPPATKRTRSV
ncbi:AMP deaminase [Fonticula alba]|uniref:AMP deaminase n=1 Tax=Fonticula alba TaxID=691883 RepID=A0A058Z125_FONAL|nr:AMP deaminase [Fonticula alba]KCV67950.1 AMP deaminase [Fonticula alba]|eukprot:XP_009497770.1 AMP deaminase [Fonticula alba]